MLDWVIVISLIIVGLVLIITEFIFIPGTTIVGILGLLIVGVGVYLSFANFGVQVGILAISLSVVISLLSAFYGIKYGAIARFSLKSNVEGRVYEDRVEGLQVGDVGVATATLKPIGKAEFADKIYEVSTLGNYVDAGGNVRIIQIKSNKIIVEPINHT